MQKKILLILLLFASFTSGIEAQTIESFVDQFNKNLKVKFPNSRTTFDESTLNLHISTKDIAQFNNRTSAKDLDALLGNNKSKNEFSTAFLNSFVQSMGDLSNIKAMGINAFKIYFITLNNDEIYGAMTKI